MKTRVISLFKRISSNSLTIDDLLLFTFLFSASLLIARVGYSGKLMFVFLAWNLFLAFLPYAFSSFLMRRISFIENKFIFIPAVLIWLSLLPNSFYIITDLFHLDYRKPVPLWYDLLLIFSFAWNGLLFGIISLKQMEKMVSVHIRNTNLFLFPVLLLSGIGIYIGRYMRYNSWDILTNPFSLFRNTVDMFLFPVEYRYAWGMIFGFSIFLILIYVTLKKISYTLQ